MSNLSRIIDLCYGLNIDPVSVELYAGYKEILFSLPDSVIDELREQGELGEAYEYFCKKYGVYYAQESELWVA